MFLFNIWPWTLSQVLVRNFNLMCLGSVNVIIRTNKQIKTRTKRTYPSIYAAKLN